MNIYVICLLVILIAAIFFTDQDPKTRKIYIIICTVMLGAVLLLRTPDVGSDIGRYRTHFVETGHRSVEIILDKYNNVGYYLYNHYLYNLLAGDYQIFLIITGVICFAPVIFVISKYAAKPYYAFLTFFCMGFYAFQFTGLKQAIAMGILCFAFHFAMQSKLLPYIITIVVAAFFHLPSLIFAPVYLIVHFKFTKFHLPFYGLAFVVIWFFRDFIVVILSEGYDSSVETEGLTGVGGKVVFMALLIIMGLLFRKPSNKDVLYRTLLQFMCVATAIQMLAIYGNVFERLADYYFFYITLFIPRIMEPKLEPNLKPFLKIDGTDRVIYMTFITGIMILYYWAFGYNTPGLLPYYTWL